MDSTLFEVQGLTAIKFDVEGCGGLDFAMRIINAGPRRDHRIVRVRGSDLDERLLQEAIYNFCDRVRILQTESGQLRLEFWRGGELIGSHQLQSYEATAG